MCVFIEGASITLLTLLQTLTRLPLQLAVLALSSTITHVLDAPHAGGGRRRAYAFHGWGGLWKQDVS